MLTHEDNYKKMLQNEEDNYKKWLQEMDKILQRKIAEDSQLQKLRKMLEMPMPRGTKEEIQKMYDKRLESIKSELQKEDEEKQAKIAKLQAAIERFQALKSQTKSQNASVYKLHSDTLLVKRNTHFFQETEGFFMLQVPAKEGMKCHVYSIAENPKFNDVVCKALKRYIQKYGKSTLSVRAEDEDGLIIGSQDVGLNIVPSNVYRSENLNEKIFYFMEIHYFSKDNNIPAFVNSMMKFNNYSSGDDNSPYTTSGRLYTRQRLINGLIKLPKKDLNEVKNINFKFKE